MKITVDLSLFRQQFINMNRREHFTYEGLEVLFDYLEELEFCEEQTELDVIALCCDFAEGTAKEIARDYCIDVSGLDGLAEDEAGFDEAITNIVREHLEDEGVLVGQTDETLVYRQF